MKKLFITFVAIVAILGGLRAWGQQQILVPTRPAGDNSNAAASTAFVQTALNSFCSLGPSMCGAIFGYTNILWWGAKCDAFVSYDFVSGGDGGSISNGSFTFTAVNHTFVAGDVGKTISINGASSTGDHVFNTTITAVSGHAVTLAAAATQNSPANTNYSYGTPNDTQWANAISAAQGSLLWRTILVPPNCVTGITTSNISITVSNVQIIGGQPGSEPYSTLVGIPHVTSGLAWIGGQFGTMVTIKPPTGAGNDNLTGIRLEGLGFAANNLAGFGLVGSGFRGSDIGYLTFSDATASNLDIGPASSYTLGGYCGVQFVDFHNISSVIGVGAGIPLREFGNSTCNASLNVWRNISVTYLGTGAWGAELAGVDNETWINAAFFGGGSATQSVYFGSNGGYTSNNNHFDHLSANFAPYVDTGTYDNWFFLDEGNSTPDPVGDATALSNTHVINSTGQTVNIGPKLSTWTPTVSSIGGNFGTAPTVLYAKYTLEATRIDYSLAIGTGANIGSASGCLTYTLPVSFTNNNQPILSYGRDTSAGTIMEGSSTLPVSTNGTTASGNNTLHFASTPSWVAAGMSVIDLTSGSAIPPGTTVLSTTGTTVVMSANASGSGVGGGDSIEFIGAVAFCATGGGATVAINDFYQIRGSYFLQ